MTFSEVLLRRRKALGLSQEALAEQVQVSRQAVSKWETGDAMPDLGKLLALAEALNLSLDALCGQETAPVLAVVSEDGPPRSRPSLLLPLCLLILGVLLGTLGTWAYLQKDLVPAEEAAALSALPDTFTVTGVSFKGNGNSVVYTFVPSVTDEVYSYQISFTDSSGHSRVFDAACVGGVCTGTADIAPYDTFQVTATVSDGSSSRSTAIALNLTFTSYSASWLPAEN